MPANERLRRFLACCLAWPEMDFQKELVQVQEFTFFPQEIGMVHKCVDKLTTE